MSWKRGINWKIASHMSSGRMMFVPGAHSARTTARKAVATCPTMEFCEPTAQRKTHGARAKFCSNAFR